MTGRPKKLAINAWTGLSYPSIATPPANQWSMRPQLRSQAQIMGFANAPPALADPRDWQSSQVGWGLVLPDNPELGPAAKARGDDAPEPLRELLKARGNAPVLRWSPELREGHLQRYYEDGGGHSRSSAAANFGVGIGQIPRYLLIYATPEEIPWRVQYSLNLSCYVGRLALKSDALERYVSALLADWAGGASSRRNAVVWSTDLGAQDITFLMARAIGGKLAEEFKKDTDLATTSLIGRKATAVALESALKGAPGLVCTTSHGMTGPLDDAAALRHQLGSPVDNFGAVVNADRLNWEPAGAIWYSHACCSAGSDERTSYEGLVSDKDAVGATLLGVAAAAGSSIAPLPTQLLGAPNPLRAFIGHVEPTFDWTLRDPVNHAVLTHTIVQCLYNRLYQADRKCPVGWALADIFSESARFFADWRAVKQRGQQSQDATDELYLQLAAIDRQTLVILGDPAVTLPP